MKPKELIDQLVTEGGAIVSSGDCSEIEITNAQATGRFAVREDALGFVRRTKEWLALQLAREKAHPNFDGRYTADTGRVRTGIELIAAERERQITAKGWSAAHDDEHLNGEMIDAAICYACEDPEKERTAPGMWPWEKRWWKPSEDPVRNLAKAGALIAAEIDRLSRQNSKAIEGRSSAPCSASLCREGRVCVTRDHIVCDGNRDELCACETEQQAAKIVAAFAALDYIATLKTDQLASAEQCSAVAVAMDVLSLPNSVISAQLGVYDPRVGNARRCDAPDTIRKSKSNAPS